MAVSVLWNTIAMPGRKETVERAVLLAIGQRPGNWDVRISEPQKSPQYTVSVEGPNGLKWSRDFFGPVEQTPEFIRSAVESAVK